MDTNLELVGWDGKIAPAPVEWDLRPHFRDERFAATIQSWTTATTEALKDCSAACQPSLDLASGLEIAPRYWASDSALLDDLGPSWQHFLLLPPFPVDSSDLHPATPYWERYVSRDGWLVGPQTEPPERGVNAQEEGQRRAGDRTSNRAIARYQRRLEARAQEQASRPVGQVVEVPALDIVHMKVEIFVRRAAPKDAAQISDILKSHDRLTCYPTSSEMTVPAVSDLITTCHGEALPFLVAVKRLPYHTEKPEFSIGRRKTAREDEVYGVTFACSRPPFDIPLPAADTTPAYLELYVRSDVCNKGIGSALLDTALSILIPIPYYFPSTGDTFAVSPEAVLGWKKKVSEVQIWLRHNGEKDRVMTWLKAPRWGFEVLGDAIPTPRIETGTMVARFRRRCAE